MAGQFGAWHEVLLWMAGRVADERLAGMRRRLAARSVDAVAGEVRAVVQQDPAILDAGLAAAARAAWVASGGPGEPPVPSGAAAGAPDWRFAPDLATPPGPAAQPRDLTGDPDRQPAAAGLEQQLDVLLRDVCVDEPGALACWRAWRWPSTGRGPHGGPMLVVVLVVGDEMPDTQLTVLAAELPAWLEQAGHPAVTVEVHRVGRPVPAYHQAARDGATLVWARPGPVPAEVARHRALVTAPPTGAAGAQTPVPAELAPASPNPSPVVPAGPAEPSSFRQRPVGMPAGPGRPVQARAERARPVQASVVQRQPPTERAEEVAVPLPSSAWSALAPVLLPSRAPLRPVPSEDAPDFAATPPPAAQPEPLAVHPEPGAAQPVAASVAVPAPPTTPRPAARDLPAGEPVVAPWRAVRAATDPADRDRVRRAVGSRYESFALQVAGRLSIDPVLRRVTDGEADLPGLVALCAYLAGDLPGIQEHLRGEPHAVTADGGMLSGGAMNGPAVDSAAADRLAACVQAGLQRMPVHRGALFRSARLDQRLLDRYGPGKVLVEPGFTRGHLAPAVGDGATVLYAMWSVSARRTSWVEPPGAAVAGGGRALFPAGTRFRVLAVDPAPGSTRPTTVLMEEQFDAAGDGDRSAVVVQRLRRALERPVPVPAPAARRTPGTSAGAGPVPVARRPLGLRHDGTAFRLPGDSRAPVAAVSPPVPAR